MEITIREATIEDLEEIVELWRKLSIGQMSKDPYYTGSFAFSCGSTQIRESIVNAHCGLFIVKYDQIIQGFIEIWDDVSGYQIFNNDSAYILHCIYDNQSQKVGSTFHIVKCLYESAKKWALERGKKYIVADVFEHNKIVAEFLARDKFEVYKSRFVRKF